MHTYFVMPNNGIDYKVDADYIEPNGGWLLFYKSGEHIPLLVHACSVHTTQYVHLSAK